MLKILKSLLLTFIFITICSYTFIDEGIRTDSEKDTYLPGLIYFIGFRMSETTSILLLCTMPSTVHMVNTIW